MGTAPIHELATWNLFIDDLREPQHVKWAMGGPSSEYTQAWVQAVVARTVSEAIDQLERHHFLPNCISFDHDLGPGEPPATEVMWYLINGHLDAKWNCDEIYGVQVHSANPVGAANLLALWEGFCRFHNIKMLISQVEAREPK